MKKNGKNIFSISAEKKASLMFVVCSFLQKGISLLTTPIFTRILSTEEYGFYSIFVSWVDIISVFTTLRLGGSVYMQAIVKFDANIKDLARSAATLVSFLSIVIFTIYFPFRIGVNRILGLPTYLVICIFISSWACSLFELWADEQKNRNVYKNMLLITIVTSVGKPLLGILAIMIYPQVGGTMRCLSMVIVEFVAYSWIFIFFFRRTQGGRITAYWKYFLTMGVVLIPHYLTRMILNQSDRLMIKTLIGYSEAGIYSLGHSIAWMLTLITNAIMNAANPWIFKQYKDKDFNSVYYISTDLLLLVSLGTSCMIGVTPELVRVFADSEYLAAIYIVPPLVVSVYFMFLYGLFATIEYYYEKTVYLTVSSTIGGIANLILNYVYIKKYGYVAAGYTTLACYIFFSVIHFFVMKIIVKKECENHPIFNVKGFIFISLALIAISSLLFYLYDKVILRYFLLILVSLCYSLYFMKKYRIFERIGVKSHVDKKTIP